MKNTWPMAVVALLVMSGAACKKENKAEQLAALDNAYQSGVLTKGEYDAKRLALVGPAPEPTAAPVTPAPVANPIAPPRNPPSGAPPVPAGSAEVSPAPAPPPAATVPPKPAPHKPSPFVTQSQPANKPPMPAQAIPPERTPAPPNTGQAAPAAQPPAAPPAREPAPLRAAPEQAEPQPLAGCVDAESKSGTVKGAVQRFYPAPPDSVIAAARAALRSLEFNVHKDTGKDIEASKQRHISAIVGAGGERLILHFEKSQRDGHVGTLATAETKKSFVGRVAQKSWTNAVLAQIACHLRERR